MNCNNGCRDDIINSCLDKFGCPDDVCPDFILKRFDTKPPFILNVSDCDGPLDLTDTIVEVSMWAKAKIKKAITEVDTYFALSDNIGFEQSLVGDIIVVNRVRAPEQMLVTGHDETNKFIRVQRGYNGTMAYPYKKGTKINIFRMLNSVGDTKMVEEDIEQIDGTTETTLTESQLIYNWLPNDTCLPGCYWLELKLLKMDVSSFMAVDSSVVPTFTSVTPSQIGCVLGNGVESMRKFPISGEGFLIKIIDTPSGGSLGDL